MPAAFISREPLDLNMPKAGKQAAVVVIFCMPMFRRISPYMYVVRLWICVQCCVTTELYMNAGLTHVDRFTARAHACTRARLLTKEVSAISAQTCTGGALCGWRTFASVGL